MRRAAVVPTATAVLLAACGQEGSAGTQSSEDDVSGGTVTVLAAASLTDVLTLVEDDFESANEGVDVRISFAASSTIVQQVNGGAPADVIALADQSSLEPLDQELMVGEPVVFITNSLQLSVPPDNPGEVGALADLASPDLSVVVCAEQVPCGNATASLFERQGLTPNVVSFEPDVRATLSKVELGEADVGVVYRTDVTAAGDRVQGIEIPEDQNVINSYPVVAVSDADLGHRFIDFLLSEGGQERLTDAGFVAP